MAQIHALRKSEGGRTFARTPKQRADKQRQVNDFHLTPRVRTPTNDQPVFCFFFAGCFPLSLASSSIASESSSSDAELPPSEELAWKSSSTV
jgi:hypothetical protein